MKRIIMASGPVIVENDKVLLNRHGEDPFWKFCGGSVDDFKHDLEEHARGTAMDEMGIQLRILNKDPFVFSFFKKADTGERIDVILFHFLAERISDINPREDIRAFEWIPIIELGDLAKNGELAPNIIPTLKHFGFF